MAANIEDLRRVARRRVPRGVFDYIDGAAEDEITYLRNSSSFHDLEFRPRVLTNVGDIDIGGEILGKSRPSPVSAG